MHATLTTDSGSRPVEDLASLTSGSLGRGFAWLDLEDPPSDQVDLTDLAARLGIGLSTLVSGRLSDLTARCEVEGDTSDLVVPFVSDESVEWLRVVGAGDRLLTVHHGRSTLVDSARPRVLHGRPLPGSALAIAVFADEAVLTIRSALQPLRETLDDLEERLLEDPSRDHVAEVARLRRYLRSLRRAITPYGIAVRSLNERLVWRDDVGDELRTLVSAHAREVEAAEQVIEAVAQSSAHALDLHQSLVANRQTQVVNRLTVVSLVFLPLTFLTGFFGMNFGYMVDHVTGPWSFWGLGLGLPVVALAAVGALTRRQWGRGSADQATGPSSRSRRETVG